MPMIGLKCQLEHLSGVFLDDLLDHLFQSIINGPKPCPLRRFDLSSDDVVDH